MNFAEQSQLVFGPRWQWFDSKLDVQYPNWATAIRSADNQHRNDVERFHLFINFILWRAGQESLFSEYRDMILCYLPNLESALHDPLAWLISWENQASEIVAFESEEVSSFLPIRSFSRLDPMGEILAQTLPSVGSHPTLHLFDRTDQMATIKLCFLSASDREARRKKYEENLTAIFHGTAPAGTTFDVEDGTSSWAADADKSADLIIDPRIPNADIPAYQKALNAAQKTRVLTATEFAEKALGDAALIQETFAIWKSFVAQSPNSQLPPYLTKPTGKTREKELITFSNEEIARAKDHIRNGHFRDAILVIKRACHHVLSERLALSDSHQKFADILFTKRDEIQTRFGRAVYSDLMDIKNTRNRAEHDNAYKPSVQDANTILKRGEIVLDALMRSPAK